MLTPDTTVLELLELHPETEEVFERYTRRLGICICCEALFCTLQEVTLRYQLDREDLMARLSRAVDAHQGHYKILERQQNRRPAPEITSGNRQFKGEIR